MVLHDGVLRIVEVDVWDSCYGVLSILHSDKRVRGHLLRPVISRPAGDLRSEALPAKTWTRLSTGLEGAGGLGGWGGRGGHLRSPCTGSHCGSSPDSLLNSGFAVSVARYFPRYRRLKCHHRLVLTEHCLVAGW